MLLLLLAAVAATAAIGSAADTWVHPGVLVSQTRLDSIKHQVQVVKAGPVYDAYQKALVSQVGRTGTLHPP